MSSPTLTGKLDSSLVIAKDLANQPNSLYILLTGGGTRPIYYAVDTWHCVDDVMTFFCGGKIVYVCRREGAWALVARAVAAIVSERDLHVFSQTDDKEQEAFFEKLDPEKWKAAKEMVAAGAEMDLTELLGGNGHTHRAPQQAKDDGKPVPGQYL